MSWDNYERALRVLENNQDECDFIGKRSESLIEKAESEIGIKFSKMYRHFLMNYGAGNFWALEIFGVISRDFVKNAALDATDAIKYTLIKRRENQLPNHYLVIYDMGDNELICLDFNSLDEKNEPAVVTIYLDMDFSKQPFEIIADDFGEYLLECVEAELDELNRTLEVTIDVSKIKTENQLHILLKEKLEFPDYYGENWSAFWDCISCEYPLPDKLILVGWTEYPHLLMLDHTYLECFAYTQIVKLG